MCTRTGLRCHLFIFARRRVAECRSRDGRPAGRGWTRNRTDRASCGLILTATSGPVSRTDGSRDVGGGGPLVRDLVLVLPDGGGVIDV